MATVRVYATFDNDGDPAYFYDGKWYGFAGSQLFEDLAEMLANDRTGLSSYSDERAYKLNLDNPDFLVYFDVNINDKGEQNG